MSTYDVLVAGEINPDLILTGSVTPDFGQVEKLVDSAALTIGSSSVIFACGAARLGLRVAFSGLCGDDVFGRFMLAEMRQRGVDVDHVIVVPGGTTGLSVILNRNTDRAILTYPGLMMTALTTSDIPADLLRQTRHLHVAAYFLQTGLQPGLPDLFRQARALGLTTSLDPNYDPSGQWRSFDELLAVTNVFLPNEREAQSLTGEDNLDRAAANLAGKVETVAIKLGAAGALAVRGAETVRVSAVPVDVVDTTGAGDSFDAGFIYGYLNHWSLAQSLRLAGACGSLSTRAVGGAGAQATLEEALTIGAKILQLQTGG